jgi:hypothetical protein
LLVAAACGRSSFESVCGDATTASGSANLVFVTSKPIAPGILGGPGGADAFCNNLATQAGLAGTYVAWISTTTTDAIDRLAGARGWQRTDGMPFADRPADIVAGRILYPPRLDEHGLPNDSDVATATNGSGRLEGPNCADFTSTGPQLYFGLSNATTELFSRQGSTACGNPMSLYCFGIDHAEPLRLPDAVIGKRVFVSDAWTPGGGLGNADAQCQTEAQQAGFAGSYKAVLATTSQSAASRFVLSNGPVVSVDGLVVATTVQAFMSDQLETSPNVTALGVSTNTEVWTGATTPTQTSNSMTCSDWASMTPAGSYGITALIDDRFFNDANSNCYNPFPLYCLEE